MLLNKQQIKEIDDLPSKIVDMQEWGGEIKIRMMSGKTRMEYEKLAEKTKLPLENVINMIIFSCVNEDNSLLFSVDDKEFLSGKSSNSLLKLFEEAVNISVMSSERLEEKAKNS